MVRSVGIAAVVVGLAWTGLGEAQSPAPASLGALASTERYVTVREEGKTPQRCQLLKTWREPNGTSAFQVKAVDTGEVMTIVGSAPGESGRALPTRIFHWGRDNKPPAGAPVPPPTASAPAPSPVSSAPPVRITRPMPQPAANPIVPYPAPAPVVSQPSSAIRPSPTSRTISSPTVRAIPVSPSQTSATTPTPLLPQTINTTAPSRSGKSTTVIVTPPPSRAVKPIPVASPVATKPAAIPVAEQKPKTVATVPSKPTQPAPQPLPPMQTRLVPTATGASGGAVPCNTCSTSPCNNCCSTCNTCCSSCVSCTPSPMRQSWIRRLFKSSPSCGECACQSAPAPTPPIVAAKPTAPAAPVSPAATVVKAQTEPARPRDWRESWGKVEPWKGAPQADTTKPASTPAKRVAQASAQMDAPKRVAQVPVKMDLPKQPGPLKDPAWFNDTAMKKKVSNSMIPDSAVAPAPSKVMVQKMPTPSFQPTPAGMPPMQAASQPSLPPGAQTLPPAPPVEQAAALPPTQPRGRVIQLAADEPNAFWSPEKPAKKEDGQQQAQQPPPPAFNAFDREDSNAPPQGMPPQGIPPRMAGGPQGPMAMGGAPMGGMPMGGMPMPMPMPPRPPMAMPAMMPDSGVPSGMANAFTLAGTRRPIPADFGGTPQEPNGFGNAVPLMDAQGPPRPYAMPRYGMMPPQYPGMQRTPGYPQQPMPYQPAMGAQGGMVVNPYMSVPPTPVAARPTEPATSAGGVPQMLTALKDSLYPSQREGAAEQLSEQNWRTQPQIVAGLMKSAHDDPAATVRAACVRALARMKVNTTEVAALVQGLKSDRDLRVRREAEEALNTLGLSTPPRQDSAIQQASHK